MIGPNGNYIFLPAVGFRYGTSIYDAGENGNYWSSVSCERSVQRAYYLGFYNEYHFLGWYSRDYGLSIRPVIE